MAAHFLAVAIVRLAEGSKPAKVYDVYLDKELEAELTAGVLQTVEELAATADKKKLLEVGQSKFLFQNADIIGDKFMVLRHSEKLVVVSVVRGPGVPSTQDPSKSVEEDASEFLHEEVANRIGKRRQEAESTFLGLRKSGTSSTGNLLAWEGDMLDTAECFGQEGYPPRVEKFLVRKDMETFVDYLVNGEKNKLFLDLPTQCVTDKNELRTDAALPQSLVERFPSVEAPSQQTSLVTREIATALAPVLGEDAADYLPDDAEIPYGVAEGCVWVTLVLLVLFVVGYVVRRLWSRLCGRGEAKE